MTRKMFDQMRTTPKAGWGGGSGFTPSDLAGPDTSSALKRVDSAIESSRRQDDATALERAIISIFDRCSC